MSEHHHEHDPIEHGDERDPEIQILEQAIRELLCEKGIIASTEIQHRIEAIEALGEAERGKTIVARAWSDPEFRRLLLADGKAALAEMGFDGGGRRGGRRNGWRVSAVA